MIHSVICFFAHPDDESILAGGLITMMTRRGIKVHLVCATRGEGGEMGEPPLCTRETLGALREGELRCAANALGASVQLLNYVDPVVGEDEVLRPFETDPMALAHELGTLARGYDLVLTHGSDGEYGHPAHRQINTAVKLGVPALSPGTLIYTLAALVPNIEDTLWNKSEPAHYALDIRPWGEAKLAAMECHLTQHALFKRRRKLEQVRDALRTVETVRRAYPPVVEGDLPEDEFTSLLISVGAWTPRG